MVFLEGEDIVLYVLIFIKLNFLYFYDVKKDLKGIKLLCICKKI